MNLLEQLMYDYYIFGEKIRLKVIILFLKIKISYVDFKIFCMKKRMHFICYFAYKKGIFSIEEYLSFKLLGFKPKMIEKLLNENRR